MSATYPNPDLAVGPDNKQRWNSPRFRRHGFHNAHRLFRRTTMLRARNVFALHDKEDGPLAAHPAVVELCGHAEFSALVCALGDRVLLERAAPDFSALSPHSIQSVTKLHIHLIVGRLIRSGHLDPDATVGHYLPWIGSGYAAAPVQNLLDMNIANDFSEDYADPHSDCYAEEIALGWRLPDGDAPEPSLREFVAGITGSDLINRSGYADYKSANTDVLTLLCAHVSPKPLWHHVEKITDAAGYEGGFHISLSPEHVPAFSGGGCLCARDLARFGLLLVRGLTATDVINGDFLRTSLNRAAPKLRPPKDWLRYSNHIMTDGRFICHTGYGGQALFLDTKSGTVCAYLSVLENESGFDDGWMARVIDNLKEICSL